MKKLLSVLLALTLAASALCVCAFAATNGDIDASNTVTAADARGILRFAVGLDKPTDAQKLAADLDMDGSITAGDARTALRIAVGLETTDGKLYSNDYDILSGTHYYVDMDVDTDGESHNVVMAITEKTTFISMKLSAEEGEFSDVKLDITIPILFAADGKTYLVDYKNRIYSEFPYEMMGMSEEELSLGSDVAFRLPSPLPKSPSGAEKIYGVACDVYTVTDGKTVQKVYMNGKKLVALRITEESGEVTTYKFNAVSLAVPSQYIAVPNDCTEVDPFELLLVLMMGGELS